MRTALSRLPMDLAPQPAAPGGVPWLVIVLVLLAVVAIGVWLARRMRNR